MHTKGFVIRCAMVVVLLCTADACFALIPAFPGAEGEGMYVSGGRGGDVYHVTNLSNTGTGSFRNGITSATGARTIVFDVSGTISLNTTLRVNKANITIAGQTAPDMGICLVNFGMVVDSGNIILQHIRVRPGDARKGAKTAGGFYSDAMELKNSNIMVDHCSTSWGIDECLSSAGASFSNITVQYCTISQGLDQTGLFHDVLDANYNPGGPSHHGYGSLIKPISGSGIITYHHNLWSQNDNRNPAVGTYTVSDTLKADIRNNVMYNNRANGYSSEESLRIDMNYVGNYVIAGNETDSSWRNWAFKANAANNMYIYQSGNKIDSDLDSVRDGTDTGWGMFTGSCTTLVAPAAMKAVTTQSADDAYNTVMASAGAFYWNRDSVDATLINNVKTMQGSIIDSQKEQKDPNGILTDPNGYPIIPVLSRAAGWDTDGDGMPNAWESWYGTNPTVADDPNGDRDSDGYKDLEEYLVWIYDPNSIHHAGDASGNDAVGFEDLSRLAASWSGTGKTWADGDYNGNGTVDFTDLSILSSNWNWQWAGAPPQEVPEPASVSLLGLSAIALLRRRRA